MTRNIITMLILCLSMTLFLNDYHDEYMINNEVIDSFNSQTMIRHIC